MTSRVSFVLSLIIIIFCTGFTLTSQTVDVTFRVDMIHENVSPKGVHIAGDFQSEAGFGSDWDPAATELFDNDGDKVYETTVSLPPGTYEYKYVNGTTWQDPHELPDPICSVHDGYGNYNRSVPIFSRDTILPVIVFDSCQSIVIFSLKLTEVPDEDEIISISGDFQTDNNLGSDWQTNIIRLSDDNGDKIYEVQLPIKEGSYNYIYNIGDYPVTYEVLPSECGVPLGNYQVRNLEVTGGVKRLPTDIFGSCDTYDLSTTTDFDTYWWNDVVFYEIFVRSFYDSDGDGIGDINGIIEKLDYLNDGDPNTTDDLGIGGIWLMPIMPSPTYHGYDATDYYDIEPDYGTLEDFERLIEEAHKRGIRIIIDYVMNHCSNEHPWFIESLNPSSSYRNWFIWRDINPGFSGPWGQQVWHNRNGKWYYGLFWSGMPDLNYDSRALRDEMLNITEFWLDKGVDGFRLDAIKYLDEDGSQVENTSKTFEILEEFNQVYKTANPEAFTVGEVWSNTASIIPYVQNNRLDVCFDFDLAYGIIQTINATNPDPIKNQIKVIQDSYYKLQYATFLTNHDIDRIFNQLGRNEKRMKQAAGIYLTLPGVPFLYYGEEVGMTGTGAHENIRRPMQWSESNNAGFSSSDPWIALGDNSNTNNVETLRADENSVFNFYKDLIHIRNNSIALRKGYIAVLNESQNDLLSYARIHDEEIVLFSTVLGNQLTIPEYNLNASALAPGTYNVLDALSGQELGSISIDTKGGFSGVSSGRSLEPRQTEILILQKDNSVSTTDFNFNNEIEIFPNPATDHLNVRTDNDCKIESINIYNLNGQIIDRSYNSRIDISALTSGMYLIGVTTCDGMVTRKWIKH